MSSTQTIEFICYPFGMVMPNRSWTAASADGYRFGFNGKENDDATKGGANSINFGGRINDPRLGLWLSVDPKMTEFPWQSPYCSMNNNPINIYDPTGESGVVVIDEKNKTITIKSTNKYFGKSVTKELAISNAKEIEDTWNAANAKKIINGVEYNVIFEVKGKKVARFTGLIRYTFKDNIFKKGRNNFCRVGPVYSTNTLIGGSTQDITDEDFANPELKTSSHEHGHFWFWFDRSAGNEVNYKTGHSHKPNSDGSPNIMQDRNQLPETDWSKRKATQQDVDKILDNEEKLKTKKKFKL